MAILRIIATLCAATIFLSGCSFSDIISLGSKLQSEGQAPMPSGTDVYTFDYPVSRALAARMISIVFGNGGINGRSNFSDVTESDWYCGYVNNVCNEGIMLGEGDTFNPMASVTYKQAQSVLKKLGLNSADKNIENSDIPVSYDLWCKMLFGPIEDKLSDYGVEKREISIFATPGYGINDSWKAATATGVMRHEGLFVDGYIDKTVEAYIKNDQIIAITAVTDESCYISGAYVKGGDVCRIMFQSGQREVLNKTGSEITDGVYDLKIENGAITEITGNYQKITDNVLKYADNKVETRNSGSYNAESIAFYSLDKSGNMGFDNKFISGGTYDLYIKDNSVKAAVFNNKFNGMIRVVLSTDDFKSYAHESALFTGHFTVLINGKEFLKTTSLHLTQENDGGLFDNVSRITLKPNSGDITIESLNRNYPSGTHPSYSGNIEVEKTENGFVIVNETDMESYIKGVLPSEMPESYGLEALMAQAVCARSYAYNQYFSGKYTSYGADCDDSVMCQVYNNIPSGEDSKLAAEKTKGQCLVYGSDVINACFFASSSGATSNSSEVWTDSATGAFPSANKEYLSARNNTGVDFSDENAALSYYKNTKAFAYDSWSPWFRWNVTFTKDDIKNAFVNNIKSVYENGMAEIHAGNTPISEFMENPGEFTNMEVLQRGEGGNIMVLRLTFEKGSADISTEYYIRSILKPVSLTGGNITLNLNDGSSVNNYSLLPSAFFAFEKSYTSEGKITSVKLYGGGMGHGAGMSQNGAKYLCEQGKNYSEILEIYYKNTDLKNMY